MVALAGRTLPRRRLESPVMWIIAIIKVGMLALSNAFAIKASFSVMGSTFARVRVFTAAVLIVVLE
jgi:hypothetical protein